MKTFIFAMLLLVFPLAQAQTAHSVISSVANQMYYEAERTGNIDEMTSVEFQASQKLSMLSKTSWSQKNAQGVTPLRVAVQWGYPNIVKVLLTDKNVQAEALSDNMLDLLAQLAPRQTIFLCRIPHQMDEPMNWVPPFLVMPYYIKNQPYKTIAQTLHAFGAPQATAKQVKESWFTRCPNSNQIPNLEKDGYSALVAASDNDYANYKTTKLSSLDHAPVVLSPSPEALTAQDEVKLLEVSSSLGVYRPSIEECIYNNDLACLPLNSYEKSFPHLQANWAYKILPSGAASLVAVFTSKSKYMGRYVRWVRTPDQTWHCTQNVMETKYRTCPYVR